MKRLTSAATYVAVVGALMAGSVGVVMVAVPLADYATDDEVRDEAASEVVSAVERESDLVTTAEVTLTWTDGRESLSGSDGLVTAVFVKSGQPIDCASPVFEVSASPVVAYCGPRPLSDDVTPTSQGRDTNEFLEFLRSVGYFEGLSLPPTTSQRRDAIRWWQGTVGQTIDSSVSPSDLLWLGESSMTPTAVEVVAGRTVRQGDVVVKVDERLASATIDGFKDQQAGRALVFNIDGSTERLPVDAGGRIDDLPTLERFESALNDLDLLVEGLPFSASGSVRLAEPIALVTVPATAIVVGTSGATCVVRTSNGPPDVVEVEVVSSNVGTVFVLGDLSSGDSILVSPDRAVSC
jgi:hypothetical protein